MNELKVQDEGVERALLGGDLSKLTEQQRVSYYGKVCASLGLNPLTQPFSFIVLNGKLTMYARRDCTDQLRSLRSVSIVISSRERLDDVYIVTAKATLPSGRTDEAIGAVPVKGLNGDALANALMKAESKSKRRVTLSICGLGLTDETEMETMHVTVIPSPAITVEPKAAAETPSPITPSSSAAAPSSTVTPNRYIVDTTTTHGEVSQASATFKPAPLGTPVDVQKVFGEENKPKKPRKTAGQNPTMTPERVEEESKRVFGGEEPTGVVPAASGNAGEKAPPAPQHVTPPVNQPADVKQWKLLAIAAKNAGLDDAARRTMMMAHVAERRGSSIVPEDWEAFKPTVTIAEADSVIRYFRKGDH